MIDSTTRKLAIQRNVADALLEDIGFADHTAQLIDERHAAGATVISREAAILCGCEWFDACFRTLDTNIQIHWLARDGEEIHPEQTLCELQGNARALLSAERPALNFLQTLSATATRTRQAVNRLQGLTTQIMDTRKTLPGLRIAQKYAVSCGGGHNQRIGLFDGILIKENHIAAAGSIAKVLANTRNAGVPVQIEVESIHELQQALDAEANLILLDNFTLDQLRLAVQITAGRAILEASGGIQADTLRDIAATGIDRISIGALTKHIHAIDLSMRIQTA